MAKDNYAQTDSIVNNDFENWYILSNANGAMDPLDWRSLNQWTAKTNRAAASRSTDAFHGQYALQITPLKSNSITDTLTSGVMNGTPVIDTINLTFSWVGSGCQNTRQKVYGYYKYLPDSNFADSAYMEIFTSSPGNRYGNFAFVPESDYKLFEVPAYGFGEPTSYMSLVFYYRSNDTSSIPKGKLLIDLLSATRPNGVNEIFAKESVQIYPNPAQEHMQILIPESMRQQGISLKIQTIEGKEVKSGFIVSSLSADSILLERSTLPAGLYIATLTGGDGEQYYFRMMFQ